MAHVDAHDEEWEKDAPLLSSLKGKQPYEAPEGYFDTLPESLLARIGDLDSPAAPDQVVTDAEPVSLGGTMQIGPKSYSIAAMIAILAAVGIYFLVRAVDVPPDGIQGPLTGNTTMDSSPFAEEELMSEVDFSLISDEEIVEMMGDEALALWEIDQMGQSLDLNLDDVDLYELSPEEIEELDDLDLDELEGFDLEGFEDLLYQ